MLPCFQHVLAPRLGSLLYESIWGLWLLAFKSHCHDRRQVSDLAKHRSKERMLALINSWNHAKSDEPLRYGIMVLLHNLLEASYQFPARHWPISKSHGTCTSHTERAAGYHCLHIATQHPVQRRWWKGITVSEIICEELMSMELRTTH